MRYAELADPNALGATIIPGFASGAEVSAVLQETQDPDSVQWLDAHETYQNARGLTIVQNHFTYALDLTGDLSPLDKLTATVALQNKTEKFIRGLSGVFPTLVDWQANELSFHLYDDPAVGLSKHRDNARFTGIIAIVAIDGECDLVINHDGEDIALPVRPGDLSLLRAPGLVDTDAEIRPEHSVENLRTPTRLSLMLRRNIKPAEMLRGFRFNNIRPEPEV